MEVYMGTVLAFGFNFAPYPDWVPCQGQDLPVAQYTALFTIIGTTYGGDGSNTFGVPNLQGRTIVGQGRSNGNTYTVGDMNGTAHLTLLQSNMPAHTHTALASEGSVAISASAYEDTGNTNTPGPTTVLAQPTTGNLYSTEQPSTTMLAGTGNTAGLSVQIGIAGGSMPVDIESPYLALNYCMATVGIFPSRDS